LKKSIIGLIAGILFYTLVPTAIQADIFFQPGPGLNDGSDEGSLNGGKDTFISRAYPNNNYGTNLYDYGSPRSTCNPADTIGLIQFDLSTLPENVDKVYLGVTHRPHDWYCYSNCEADFYFYPVTQYWNEMGVTHNSAPAIDTANPVYGPVHIEYPNNFGVREYDITEIYRAWKNGSIPNNGLAIFSPDTGCNNASVTFTLYSSDDSNVSRRPYLRVVPTQTNVPLSNAAKALLAMLFAFAAFFMMHRRRVA
jgi:hypothetical protein